MLNDAGGFIHAAQAVNAALDAKRWEQAEQLALAALEAAREKRQSRWAERFERLCRFARARGRSEERPAAPTTCSFCAGELGGDRCVAGASVLICSGCVSFLCDGRLWENLPPSSHWTFAGDEEPTDLTCLFCGIAHPLFVGRPGGLCSICLDTAAECLDVDWQ